MFPILRIGPLALQLPGLFLLAGVWVGTWLLDGQAPRRKLSAGVLNNLVFIGLVAGLLGGRLWYALRFLEVYLENPGGLFSLNPSTLAPVEGTLTGIIAAAIYGGRKRLPLWDTLDALAPSLAAFAVAFGLAHLSSGDAFGAPSDLPWAIELWGTRRHPSQVYEVLAGGVVTLAVWRLSEHPPFPGCLFFTWLGLAAASRLFLEAFRGDSVIVFGTLRSAQLVSLGLLLGAMLGLHLLARRGAGTQRSIESPQG